MSLSGNFENPANPAACRNYGASKARGSHLLFLDDDDECHLDFIQSCVSHLKNFPEHSFLLAEHLEIRTYSSQGDHQSALVDTTSPVSVLGDTFPPFLKFGMGCGFVLSREFFRELGGFDVEYSYCEDTELLLRIHFQGMVPYPIPGQGIIVHRHLETRRTGDMNTCNRVFELEKLVRSMDSSLQKSPAFHSHLLQHLDKLRSRCSRVDQFSFEGHN
ncbi:glycosyltransferase [Roseateles sp. DC23W]|uniref:Glycosyltransferase n=1 Tax=Pelomonas dachongensis TaxID=3299029 RepID=A0ABW7EXJ7_9BURK